MSLLAALNTKIGEVLDKTAAQQTLVEFVALIVDMVTDQPRGNVIRVISGNSSAYKNALVKD